jgi:hypothetical protein
MAEVFRAEIRSNGKTAAGISVPPEVVERLGQGKRPPVTVTIAGHSYRSSVAVMGGEYLVGVSVPAAARARRRGREDRRDPPAPDREVRRDPGCGSAA